MQTISIDISLYIGIFKKNYCMYCLVMYGIIF